MTNFPASTCRTLLAASSSRTPLGWLRDRLVFLLPPFWLATAFGFLAAGLAGHKRFDGFQVICQFMGIGYLTHGERMVNVATWFMTPLLCLYVIAALARLSSPRAVFLSFSIFCLASAMFTSDRGAVVACHGLTFSMAYLIGTAPIRLQRMLVAGAFVTMALLFGLHQNLRYGLLSFGLLFMSLGVRRRLPLAEKFSAIAYEWFLLHGLCLTMVAVVFDHPLIVAPLAAIASIVLAVALRGIVQRTRVAAAKVFPKSAAPVGVPALKGRGQTAGLQH